MFKVINDMTKVDDKSILQRDLKTVEEVGELAEAVETNDVPEIVEETADVFLCAVSVMVQLSDDEVRLAAELNQGTFEQLYANTVASTDVKLSVVTLSKHVGLLAQATLSATGSSGSSYKKLTNLDSIRHAGELIGPIVAIYKTTPGSSIENFIETVTYKSVKWLTKVTEQKNAKLN